MNNNTLEFCIYNFSNLLSVSIIQETLSCEAHEDIFIFKKFLLDLSVLYMSLKYFVTELRDMDFICIFHSFWFWN